MKKIFIIIVTVFLNMAFFSCTPQNNLSDEALPQACCDQDGDIPPPPPPPPGGNGN